MKRILISKIRSIGDVALAAPAFEGLRRTYPKAWISAITSPPMHDLLKHSGWVNEVFAYHKGQMDRLSFWERLWKTSRLVTALQKRDYDLAIDLYGTRRSAQLMHDSRANFIIGTELAETKGYYDVTVPAPNRLTAPANELDNRAMALAGVQCKALGSVIWPVPPRAKEFAERFWDIHELDSGEPVVAVNPFASCKTKEWYPEKWADFLRGLAARGLKFFVTCAPLERPGLGKIAEKARMTFPYHAEHSLMNLMGLFQKASAVISVDSGPKHLAAAVGTPTLTIWGPELPSRWHPYPLERHPLAIKEVPCRPCGLFVCVERKHECMVSLMPEDVLNQLSKLLDAKASNAPA